MHSCTHTHMQSQDLKSIEMFLFACFVFLFISSMHFRTYIRIVPLCHFSQVAMTAEWLRGRKIKRMTWLYGPALLHHDGVDGFLRKQTGIIILALCQIGESSVLACVWLCPTNSTSCPANRVCGQDNVLRFPVHNPSSSCV